MPIRTQLIILVLAVIAPVALLAAMATVGLWDLQRDAYSQRFQERVSALRIALDTELDSSMRHLRDMSETLDLDAVTRRDSFRAQAVRLLGNHPAWSMIGLIDAEGRTLSRADRHPALAGAKFDDELLHAVKAAPRGIISNLVDVDPAAGTFVTFISVPLLRDGVFRGAIYIGMESATWLEFFKRYPIHERATLTLNDRSGRIIVRTLNNDKWAGKRSTPQYLSHTAGRDEGAMLVTGVDGQRFYSAFSRSRISAWVVGTGVPQDDVEAALSRPTLMILLSVFAAGGLATVFAYLLGGRITGALTTLTRIVASVASGEEPRPPQAPLPIAEAETVRRALNEGAELLAARERSLNEAIAREAKSREAAEFASRAKDDLLAMLGHELRNPLNAIKAAVAVLETPQAKAKVIERARAVVHRQIGHLTSIIDDLLDVARLDSGKTQLRHRTLDLALVASHVVDTFRDTGRSAEHRIVTDMHEAWIVGDEARLAQVVSNLLDNACKYTPRGGSVRISVSTDADQVLLAVSDTGSGIAPDVLPKIFDLFAQGARTLDRAQGGLGLGLTVVRRLVDLHGGTIEARSEGLDRGATFMLRFPRVQPGGRTAAAAPPPRIGPLDVVVVEDNPDNRHLVAEMMRMRGHRVREAGDGVSGVKAMLEGHVDLAIIDIGLPGWDGYEVARRVRAALQDGKVRLVALTGYGREDDRARALAAGFDLFLIKPFDLEALEAGWMALEAASVRAAGDARS